MSIKQGSNFIAGSGGGIANYDGISITENANEEIQTIGVINQNDTTTAIKTWTGTKAQYDAIATKDATTLYNITDDTDFTLTLLETLYPVGSIYITTAASCPLSTLITGSTWELVSSGRVLQGADSGHSAGTTAEAGLPNITGSITSRGFVNEGNWAIQNATGALNASSSNHSSDYVCAGTNTVSNMNSKVYNFSASASSSIYGNSTTVQPPAYFVNIYRRTA